MIFVCLVIALSPLHTSCPHPCQQICDSLFFSVAFHCHCYPWLTNVCVCWATSISAVSTIVEQLNNFSWIFANGFFLCVYCVYSVIAGLRAKARDTRLFQVTFGKKVNPDAIDSFLCRFFEQISIYQSIWCPFQICTYKCDRSKMRPIRITTWPHY